MLKECRYIPKLETDRLILGQLLPGDAEDPGKWLGRDEVYTYWGRPAGKGEKNPELLFVDPGPNVRRKPTDENVKNTGSNRFPHDRDLPGKLIAEIARGAVTHMQKRQNSRKNMIGGSML